MTTVALKEGMITAGLQCRQSGSLIREEMITTFRQTPMVTEGSSDHRKRLTETLTPETTTVIITAGLKEGMITPGIQTPRRYVNLNKQKEDRSRGNNRSSQWKEDKNHGNNRSSQWKEDKNHGNNHNSLWRGDKNHGNSQWKESRSHDKNNPASLNAGMRATASKIITTVVAIPAIAEKDSNTDFI